MRLVQTGTVLLALALLLVWSGPAAAQGYDVKKGQFLTAEEYSKLKAEQAAAYCSELEAELAADQARLNELRGQADGQRAEVERLKSEIQTVTTQVSGLRNDIAAMEKTTKPYEGKDVTHTVAKGEYLSLIASYDRIYGDAKKWPRLYRANRDKIHDPNLIYPGQVLKVPQGYPTSHTVVAGEFLAKIAGYWEIYDNAREWPKIYEANKDKIKDPDLIYPDQVLTIPR
jgi:nucleoid-associated protein YgaU